VDLADGRAVPVQRGLSKGVTGRVRIAQFNDPDLLRAALEPGDVALVLTEPAMTNNLHLLLPEPGWHQALRGLTRQHGTLLGIDETHTHVVRPGGASGLWQLDPDIVTIGKAVAGGLPMGAYGVTAELGEQLDAARNVATGGTLFGNPLSAAAAKAALTEVLVPGAYAHTSALGSQLADGIEQAIGSAGLPWTVIRLGPRTGQWYGPMPRTGAQAHALADNELTRLIRAWLANRGIWEALPGAGPPPPSPPPARTWPATSAPTASSSPSCANPDRPNTGTSRWPPPPSVSRARADQPDLRASSRPDRRDWSSSLDDMHRAGLS
jgi:glutamate-1-semialdehyde 2,1-aminomutase